MATGPEHYEAAEQLIGRASDDELGSDAERYHVTKAQVHAALALAAATALRGFTELPVPDAEAWLAAAGGQPVEYSEARPDYDPDAR